MADYRDEKRLIAGLRTGEREAFERLLDLYQDKVYGMVRRMVGEPDAEDVTQDAFLAAFERLDSCREPARFSGWLLRIVRNRALSWVSQRQGREPRRPPVRPRGSREGRPLRQAHRTPSSIAHPPRGSPSLPRRPCAR